MFTGIIEKQGRILSVEKYNDSLRIVVDSQFYDLALGESIAVNGVCLTVETFTPQGQATFFISPETQDRSNLNTLSLRKDESLNLERALTLQTRISGHLVQGHVDGIAQLVSYVKQPDKSLLLQFKISNKLARYCIEKGSISLNGVSLTINSIEKTESGDESLIKMTIIPHTAHLTNLPQLEVGSFVNVEVDILGKYVERLWHP